MAGTPEPRVADTSCLYALFDDEDPHHKDALQEVGANGPLVIPGEVLVETMGLVTHRAGRAMAKRAQRYLEGLPHVEFTHPTDIHEVLALDRRHPGLGIVDAAVVWHCRRLGARPATFDARVRRLAGR